VICFNEELQKEIALIFSKDLFLEGETIPRLNLLQEKLSGRFRHLLIGIEEPKKSSLRI
jgi:hypothetical protein